MGLVAIPIAVGVAGLVTWLAKLSGPSLPSSKATVRVVSQMPDLPPLKTFTENEVFGKPPAPPPPPSPAPAVAPPAGPAVAEKPVMPPAPKVEASPLPAKVTPPAPAPAAPVVEQAPPAVEVPADDTDEDEAPAPPPAPPPPPPVAAPPVAVPPPAAATPPAALPPAPVVEEALPAAPTVADVATPPAGFDRALAGKMAKQVADNIAKKSYDYDRALVRKFQVAAGIAAEGVYGPEAKGALLFYGIRRPPRALFKGADGTMNEVPYKWA